MVIMRIIEPAPLQDQPAAAEARDRLCGQWSGAAIFKRRVTSSMPTTGCRDFLGGSPTHAGFQRKDLIGRKDIFLAARRQQAP